MSKAPELSEKERAQSIDSIPAEFLICRDLGHAWAPHDVKISRKYGEIHRILKCRNCPTERTQVLSLDGDLMRNKYDYPEGYTLSGVGYLSASDRAHIRVMGTQQMKAGGL